MLGYWPECGVQRLGQRLKAQDVVEADRSIIL